MTTKLTNKDKQFIKECHPSIQKLFNDAANDKNCPSFCVLDGARTVEEQRANVKRGASKTMRSRHIPGDDGWSHAIDVAPLFKGKITWDWKYYYPLAKRIKTLARKNKIKVTWGGDWKTFKDGPHWQLPWGSEVGNEVIDDMIDLNSEPTRNREGVGNFRVSIPLVLKHEGGFVNDLKDKGGATNMGITLRTYRKYHKARATVNDLKKMTKEVAVDIYKQHYWDVIRADMLPGGVDHAVFDFAVHSGPVRAKRYLQMVVDTPVDGRIGKDTLSRVNHMAPTSIIEKLCDMREDYIKERVASRKLNSKFRDGILARIKRVRKEALGMVNVIGVDDTPPARSDIIRLILLLISKLFGKGIKK